MTAPLPPNVLVLHDAHAAACRQLAGLLAGLRGWEVAEVREPAPRRGIARALQRLREALRGARPAPALYDGPDPAQFDAVVLVAPAGLRGIAGPLRRFLADRHDRLPEVGLVTVTRWGSPARALAECERLLGRAPILEVSFRLAEMGDGRFAPRLQAFSAAMARCAVHVTAWLARRHASA